MLEATLNTCYVMLVSGALQGNQQTLSIKLEIPPPLEKIP